MTEWDATLPELLRPAPESHRHPHATLGFGQRTLGMEPEVLVLLSGGLDSAAVLDFYLRIGRPVVAMFVDYGQIAAHFEGAAARSVAVHFGVQLMERRLFGATAKRIGEIPARNGFLLAVAAMERPESVWGIACGIHAGTGYPDCSERFADLQRELCGLSGKPIDVLAPFLTWEKSAVLGYCDAHRVPAPLTYSCESGTMPPCGSCPSCLDRKEFDARTSR